MTWEQFCYNLLIRPEQLGMHVLLSHFAEHVSSQRLGMVGNHFPQADIIDGCETARFQTGFETKYGRYGFGEDKRTQDVQVQEVIPKFIMNMDSSGVRGNSCVTIIYIGNDDNKIGYFNIPTYTELHAGFGYKNKKLTNMYPMKGDFIPKEMKFYTAPNHDDDLYNIGTNANVCYIPMWDTTDDAFVVSETLANKLTHTVMNTVDINIDAETVPLNLYGDDTLYKCFPDIGTRVRDDGLIMALRKRSDDAFITDFTAEELCTPKPLYDDIFSAPPGAEILDIQVFINHKMFSPKKKSDVAYTQLMEYQNYHNRYYDAVISTYEELTKQGYKCSPEFSDFVTRCKAFCYYRGGKSVILTDKKDPIEFMKISITYCYKEKASLGSKITGTDGSKGVISAIWKDEDMPMSQDGVRADLLITAESPFNRLNSSQLYEQFLTLCSEIVARNVRNGTMADDQAFEYVMDYYNDVMPAGAVHIREKCNTPERRHHFINAVKADGIYMIVPPYTATINPDLILKLAKKHNITRGPLTYYKRHPDGSREKIVTRHAGIIGSKYIILLGKRPLDQLSAIELGYVNQFMTPTKPNSKMIRAKCQHRQTPCREGEDEINIFTVSLGVETTARIMGLYSNSQVALTELSKKLLTVEHPSALKNVGMSTEDIIMSSANIGLFKHQFFEIGYELTTQYEEET